MDRKQKKKLALVASVLAIAGGIAYMIMGTFQESLVYFYTPTEVMQQKADLQGKKIRLAGQVLTGSLAKADDKVTISFKITDGTNSIPVTFRGVVPDLFAEGQMAVAEGRPDGEGFKAELIMAKHSEDYDSKNMKYPHVQDRRAEKW
jgi:cytochrome c-type biogenesis protein CcmE